MNKPISPDAAPSPGISSPVEKPKNSSSTGRLGTTNEIVQCGTLPNTWKLQDGAGKLLPAERIAGCMRRPLDTAGAVSIYEYVDRHGEVRTSYRGLMRCGSVWICPICSSIIARHRQQEIEEAIHEAKSRGWTIQLVSWTISHTWNDSLDDVRLRLTSSRRTMKNRAGWKLIAKKHGILGSVRTIEITHGENGWHIHIHEIFFLAPGAAPLDQTELLEEWSRACKSSGVRHVNEHAVEVSKPDMGTESAYVTKWSLADEISQADLKTPRGNLTMWGVLAKAITGDLLCRRVFIEYAGSIKGMRRFMWSAGLRSRLVSTPEKTDEEIIEDQSGPVIHVISFAEWKVICSFGLRGKILDLFRLGQRSQAMDMIESASQAESTRLHHH